MADEQFPLEHFLGGKIAPETQALAGMKVAEGELANRFDAAKESQEAQAKALAPLQKALGDAVGPALDEAAANLQTLAEDLAGEEVAVPDPPREEGRIFPGSIGLRRVPPYDYRWTWNVQAGSPRVSVNADTATGQQSFFLYNADSSAQAWAANAVGVYYRPMYSGYLHIWSNAALNYNWSTYAVLHSAHSDGWLGLYVGQYDLAGSLDRVPVSQRIYQWYDDSWWGGAGNQKGSNPGYPLSAWVPVTTPHWYTIRVWSGGSMSGAGWPGFGGSSASANLAMGVPSINMALY